MRYLIILFLSTSLFAEFKVIGYGISKHSQKTFTEVKPYVSTYDSHTTRVEVRERKFNSEHKLIGIEYESKGYSVSIVSYNNSYYRITNSAYVSKLWEISGLEYKLSVGLVSGYKPRWEDRDEFQLMGMPSIQKKIGNFEIEVGFLGTALIGMFKLNFGE